MPSYEAGSRKFASSGEQIIRDQFRPSPQNIQTLTKIFYYHIVLKAEPSWVAPAQTISQELQMSNDHEEVRKRLLDRNIIFIDDEINGKMASYVCQCTTNLFSRGCPPITVIITSNGGDVTVGLDIYDILSIYPAPIEGVVVGYARSMATVILQACSKRCSCEHARIMIHHISQRQISLDVIRRPKRTRSLCLDMEVTQNLLYNILSKRTGQPVNRVRTVCKQNKDMTAKQALEFGLIDVIVPVRKDIIRGT